MKTPKEIVQIMLAKDQFSAWIGLELKSISKGHCELTCTIKKEMLNGFEILHGGITYSLSDSALAFASNAHGFKCVSIETSISHLIPVRENEELLIIANEVHRGKSIGIYTIDIFNQEKLLVSKFKGTVSISREEW